MNHQRTRSTARSTCVNMRHLRPEPDIHQFRRCSSERCSSVNQRLRRPVEVERCERRWKEFPSTHRGLTHEEGSLSCSYTKPASTRHNTRHYPLVKSNQGSALLGHLAFPAPENVQAIDFSCSLTNDQTILALAFVDHGIWDE